ncbi:hypothetical protein M2132_001849 [Dysgonomonas sp. PH5-45]|uniref:hypothetical protein n=1 Tax=unclassified Dysgonomonas TaxID=2630389 RepID=UPI0024742C7B|nr:MULTISPECIES: hypothetical protein [unclassified Dysgonomonas]MDH6355504.1 hypothetical protein [Dysgonomonas sp. PH5-45]MDH6388435.1 hypothetical protein [Dysgonomonas sp. PH5-37]
MKIIYKSILLSLCTVAGFCLDANAQKDSTLNRQVSIERDYTPVIQDASKINTLPAVQQSAKPNTNVRFATDIPRLSLSRYPVMDTGAATIGSQIDYSKDRGYLVLGVGSNLNLDGRIGYRLLNTKTDRLDVFAGYNSANSDVDYAEKEFLSKKEKAKYSDGFFKVKYQHDFDKLSLFVNGNYLNNTYNYYGNDFPQYPSLYIPRIDPKEQQTVNVFGVDAGIKSLESLQGVQYAVDARYNHFNNKYGLFLNEDGTSGGILDGHLFLGALVEDKKVGVDVWAMHQTFDKLESLSIDGLYDNLTVLKGRAFFAMDGGDWQVSLGAKISYAFDHKNKFAIAPDVQASYTFAPTSRVYAGVTGGINENNFLQTLQENRYLAPLARVGYSNTLYDAVVGVKSGVVRGFEFDIFGGYKYTKDNHLYVGRTRYMGTYSWGNIPMLVYANMGEGHVGTAVKTSLIPYVDLSVRAKGYFYDVKYVDHPFSLIRTPYVKKAWGRPTFSVDVNAEIRPFEKLLFSLNYTLQGGRKTYFGKDVKMNDINELNLRGEYQLLKWLGINISFNNVLNQKYETFYGYTHQQFHVMGGVSLKF